MKRALPLDGETEEDPHAHAEKKARLEEGDAQEHHPSTFVLGLPELRALIVGVMGDLMQDIATLIRLRLVSRGFYATLERPYPLYLNSIAVENGDHVPWTFVGRYLQQVASRGVRDPRFLNENWLIQSTMSPALPHDTDRRWHYMMKGTIASNTMEWFAPIMGAARALSGWYIIRGYGMDMIREGRADMLRHLLVCLQGDYRSFHPPTDYLKFAIDRVQLECLDVILEMHPYLAPTDAIKQIGILILPLHRDKLTGWLQRYLLHREKVGPALSDAFRKWLILYRHWKPRA